MEFKDKLKQLRTEKGISQQALADAIHVSRSAVAKWENGLGYPSRDCYEALMAYFAVNEEFFRTEEPEAVIVTKNRHIQILRNILICVMILAAAAAAMVGCLWISTADESDTERLSELAAEYLGYEELDIVRTAKRGDYMAALCIDPDVKWSMCVFERDNLLKDRWNASGGKKSISPGVIGSWNYGSPQSEAILIFCGGGLPGNIRWYSFENSGIEYICPVNDAMVLDIFIIPDSININGYPTPLDSDKQPIE